MSLGLVGRKVGMTCILTDDGDSTPVTASEVGDNRVTQIKTGGTDGYTAVQVTPGARHASRVIKPPAGHLTKAGVEADEIIKEFRVDVARAAEFQPGVNISVDLFEVGQKIDAQGTAISKGYVGTIKHYNFSSGRAPYGNSRSHNVSGLTDMVQDPGRVFPGKRMTGHTGDIIRTVQNLEIAKINAERKLLLVKGAILGAKGGQIIIMPIVKARAEKT